MTHNFNDDLEETGYNTAPFYAKYGRIGRMRYLAYTAILTLCAVVPFALGILLSALIGSKDAIAITLITGIPTIIIAIYARFAPGMRRFNDLNRSSWWAALLLIPLISLFVILYLSFAAGDEDDNDYGEPAEPPTTLIKVVGVIGFVILILMSFAQFVPR
ncbi:DUF805 domain-containing protein [Alysiella filiformis]|uniref:Uncharacterized membrane protein YhaH, DUF805 family n=1 Tax=Alysiella filiformis DSM 16848 TaxID=1120981 RepID=A0A286EG94_9NEIS|nr:DUF805 domain-containing protein [Alysiella filiformis]QMT30526.1 DUF805 domain-containing protein [Alysiella filiformis]UBQ56494.1 DUF805 domain-containing protein [Alysiella filiformis DSM 16848]SOD69946.1 Uncharacterized membrane protein YhaH, DUF805 family [Alysiella filiformis DSM 16848]